jgi:mRNA interferase MazF
MPKGDIVLISFPFTDLTSSKNRQAVIIGETSLDVTVCFITTQLHWQEDTDIKLLPNSENGLKKESLIRINKIATIENNLIKGLLGKLHFNEVQTLNKMLNFF